MQSAFQHRAAAHLPAGITAAEPVAGIVLGMVVFGDSTRVSPGLILLGASGLAALAGGFRAPFARSAAVLASAQQPRHAVRAQNQMTAGPVIGRCEGLSSVR